MQSRFLTGQCRNCAVAGSLVLCFACILLFFSGTAFAADFEPSDIPVLYLHIDGGQSKIDRMNQSEDHSYRCTGTMDLEVPAGYSGQASLSGVKMDYIRGRGNTT